MMKKMVKAESAIKKKCCLPLLPQHNDNDNDNDDIDGFKLSVGHYDLNSDETRDSFSFSSDIIETRDSFSFSSDIINNSLQYNDVPDVPDSQDATTGLLSQDLFSSQDYCTPAQAQDSMDLDSLKGKFVCPASPVKATTVKSKRQRDSIDRVSANIILPSGRLAGFESANNDENPEPIISGTKRYISQSALALRARVMSPPCVKNPYLTEDEELSENVQRSIRRIPACIGQAPIASCISRYRSDFQEIEEIGQGNFSYVYKVLNRIDGCCYAVKRSRLQLHKDSERKNALMEVQALAALGFHKNVIGYYSSWFESNHLFIQMELCDYNLLTALDRGSLKTATDFLEAMYQIAKALAFIHERGIAHLDVKPDNIYVRDGIYKLGDFGRATLLNGSLHIEEGDARYMSHEILNDNYEHLDKADMYSLGFTFYELLQRKQSPMSERCIDRNGEIKIPILPGISVYFQKLLQELVSNDPQRRPSAKSVLRNPLFSKVRAVNEA